MVELQDVTVKKDKVQTDELQIVTAETTRRFIDDSAFY